MIFTSQHSKSLGWMVPRGFQVLSFDVHGLNKKEPGGQTHLQSSPTVPLSAPHSELFICGGGQESSQILKYTKQPKHAHSNTKISFLTQNLTSGFYQHFQQGTTCHRSRTKVKQHKFPNFPYELHQIESHLWTDFFLVLDLFLEFSFFLFIPLSSLTKWQGLPCHLS